MDAEEVERTTRAWEAQWREEARELLGRVRFEVWAPAGMAATVGGWGGDEEPHSLPVAADLAEHGQSLQLEINTRDDDPR